MNHKMTEFVEQAAVKMQRYPGFPSNASLTNLSFFLLDGCEDVANAVINVAMSRLMKLLVLGTTI